MANILHWNLNEIILPIAEYQQFFTYYKPVNIRILKTRLTSDKLFDIRGFDIIRYTERKTQWPVRE